jgi:hypothetical protein
MGLLQNLENIWKIVAGSSILTALFMYVLLRFTNLLDTTFVERIKAEAQRETWTSQTRWNFKKDAYVRLIETTQELLHSKMRMAVSVNNTEQYERYSQQFASAFTAFRKAVAVSVIVLEKDGEAAALSVLT